MNKTNVILNYIYDKNKIKNKIISLTYVTFDFARHVVYNKREDFKSSRKLAYQNTKY